MRLLPVCFAIFALHQAQAQQGGGLTRASLTASGLANEKLVTNLYLGATQTMASDMSALVRVNACNSPGLKRFQENLMLFALAKQPIRLSGGGSTAPAGNRPSTDSLSKNQNLPKLLADLVLEQSRTWVMNRFVSGSVSNVVVSSRDSDGRPSKVTGSYLYNGQSRGSVTISFSDGLPECMYFFDFPTTCRTPNRRVVEAYANGAYRQ